MIALFAWISDIRNLKGGTWKNSPSVYDIVFLPLCQFLIVTQGAVEQKHRILIQLFVDGLNVIWNVFFVWSKSS